MFSCPLCNDWLYVNSLCEECKKTRNIVRCYGIERVNKALSTFFLREEEKVDNKVKKELQVDLKKNEIQTRSKSVGRHKGVRGLDGEKE